MSDFLTKEERLNIQKLSVKWNDNVQPEEIVYQLFEEDIVNWDQREEYRTINTEFKKNVYLYETIFKRCTYNNLCKVKEILLNSKIETHILLGELLPTREWSEPDAEQHSQLKEEEKYAGKEDLTMLMLGKTGHGKSATGNTILCEEPERFAVEYFSTSTSGASHTSQVGIETRTVQGRQVTVVDTPGMCDTKQEKDEVLKEISTAVALAPNGYDAFIFIIKYPTRLTEEERQASKQFKEVFTKVAYDYSIGLFTHGEAYFFEREKNKKRGLPVRSFEDVIYSHKSTDKDAIGTLMEKVCKAGIVLFDNHEKDFQKRREMVSELFKKIDELKANKSFKRFDSAVFKEARRLRAESRKNKGRQQEYKKQEETDFIEEGIFQYLQKKIASCNLL